MPSDSFSRPKPKVVKRKQPKAPPPKTDVQSSGPGYGLKKAAAAKKTRVYKISEGAAKPSRQTDATSSGPGYGKTIATGYHLEAQKAVKDAKAGKPFSPYFLEHAKTLGLPDTKDYRFDNGRVIHKHRRDLLPDYDVVLDPKKGGNATPAEQTKAGVSDTLTAGVHGPVVKILGETVRPLHAIAGLASEGTHGFTEGLLHNKPYTFGKVFKKAGLPSAAAAGLGFVADVGLDPTTYLTGGAARLAEKEALKAGEKAAAKGAKAGMSEAGQQAVARAAAKRAVAKAKPGKGVTVKFAGHELPGVTKVTAAVGRGGKKAAAKAPGKVKLVGAGAKNAVRDVRPQIRPAGTPEAQFLEVRHAGRKARSSARAGIDQASQRARGVADRLSKSDHSTVIDAIETGNIKSLPPHLHEVAVFLRDEFRHARRVRREAGVPEGTVRNYFPHAHKDTLEGDVRVEAVPPKGPRTVSGPSRKIKLTVKEANAKNPGLFSTNVPLVAQNYGRQTAVKAARAKLYRDLGAAGTPVRIKIENDGSRTVVVPPVKAGEAVYHIGTRDGRFGIREVPADQAGKGAGKFVVLNKQLVDHQLQGITQAERSAIGAGVDRLTSGFKRLATLTPGFHARNLVGDTQMAYLAQPGHVLPRNVGQSAKALRRLSETERAQRQTLGRVKPSTKTIKVAGNRVGIDDFLRGAKANGVVRSGYIGRELEELKGVGKGARRVTKGGTEKVKRWMQNREDLMRIATYKHGLDKGLAPAQAADLSLSMHIDYGDLTQFERKVARRAAPFYTFSSRALPIHAKALVSKPGKFANFEKVREEAATATGIDLTKQQKHLKGYQSRQAPLILKIGGKRIVVSDALPLTLLNEIPTSANMGAYIDELAQWVASLSNPIIKDPVELYANRSFFFRSDLESKITPLVAAPSWVSAIYNHDRGLADKLGIVPDYIDKKTGKKTWGWRGKADYIFKSVPGAVNFAQQLMTEGNRRGQSTGQKLLGFTAGVKVEPLDPVGAAMEVLFQSHDALDKEAAAYSRRAKSAANAHAVADLRRQQHAIERQIYKLSRKRGDKVPLYAPGGGGGGPSIGSGLSGGLGSGL